jgi:hypothetical protein
MKDETEPPRPLLGHYISTTTGTPPDAGRCNTRTVKAATAGQPGDVTLFFSPHEDGVALDEDGVLQKRLVFGLERTQRRAKAEGTAHQAVHGPPRLTSPPGRHPIDDCVA